MSSTDRDEIGRVVLFWYIHATLIFIVILRKFVYYSPSKNIFHDRMFEKCHKIENAIFAGMKTDHECEPQLSAQNVMTALRSDFSLCDNECGARQRFKFLSFFI